MINLISNAIKFTDKGVISCGLCADEEGALVSVSDTGIGIRSEDLNKVFQRFAQIGDPLTDKPQGSGLGLSICKRIIENHNGKIWVNSQAGKGSTFYFQIPYA